MQWVGSLVRTNDVVSGILSSNAVRPQTSNAVIPVTTVQRILQTLDAFLVEPLPAAATLQHLHEPLSILPTVAVALLCVAAVALIP
jgi:hypothetical protein